MAKAVVNKAASVHQRLLNLARERKEDFGLVLTKYVLERVLYRISQSKYRDVFVLKGALLFELWTAQRYRPTRDADFLARGENTPERFITIFKEMCRAEVRDDGLRFDPASVTAERISEDADYEGIRVKFVGYLENARAPVQIDMGFGDVITPAPREEAFPTMLDLPGPKLLMYPKESVIAEKFEALVTLDVRNSRMKDLHDLRSLCREFSFDGAVVSEAIVNTFRRRKTDFPVGKPVAFTSEFFASEDKKKQWHAFCNKNKNYIAQIALETTCLEIAAFLMPVLEAVRNNEQLDLIWRAGGPWS